MDEEAICNIYYNCHYLFHHVVIAKKQEYLEGRADLSLTLNILKYSVKFLKCCIGNYLLHVLDRATRFVHGMKLTDDEHLQIVQLQIDILELTYCEESERCIKISNEDIYKSYMSLLSSILKSMFDTKHLQKAQDVVKKTVECINVWNKSDAVSESCSVLLHVVLNLFLERPEDFANRLEACTMDLESLMLKYRDSKILNWTCISIAHVLHDVSSYWLMQHAEEWNQHMSLHVQKAFFRFISSLSEVIVSSVIIIHMV